jgi:hypothetical protein
MYFYGRINLCRFILNEHVGVLEASVYCEDRQWDPPSAANETLVMQPEPVASGYWALSSAIAV